MGMPQIVQFFNAFGMQKWNASSVHGDTATIRISIQRKREAQMKLTVKAAAIAFLAAGLVFSYAQTSGTTPPAKKHAAAKKPAAPAGPTVQQQIDDMKQQFQGEIDGLKADLATKDEQLKQAQQAAADAQAAAAKAEADATAQQQAVTDNASAVTTLQSTVSDLKINAVSLATTVSDETTNIKKAINNPTTLHYKGITLTPGGYAAGETVWRAHATGGDIPTAFTSLPYEHGDNYTLSEFFGSARQSRMALMAEGKVPWGTVRGYFEGDWLGTGITSNNNQSNSYVFRQRVIWAQAETNDHWAFTGGQLWSLATEDKKGISNLSGDIMTPQTIDPNYNVGFVWTRQYGFRVTKTWKTAAIGAAIENPQLIYTASLAGNTPYAVLGSQGTNGGNYNAAISTCTPATSIVNYTNQSETDSAGNTINVAVPVYKTLNGCANITNLSFNYAPDVILKLALDPGWGHYEIIGIGGFAHETVYPGETTNGNLYGGLTDIGSGLTVAPALTTAGAHSDSITLGGVAASFRVPLGSMVSFGLKGLYGPGVGRYGDSTLADVTADANGNLAPIHDLSSLVTLEINPTPRLSIYFDGGIDYAARTDFQTATASTLGAPSACFLPTGATACTTTPTALQLEGGGKWGGHWGAPSAAAVGYGSRLLSNSSCTTNSNPGYNGGGSTGYIPGGSCGAQNRDIQEYTAGYWYDFYKGDHGRFRQSIQYSYTAREGWSGAGGIGAKGIDNMFWTSFRYYLP
jgi:Skp family chaperone for outer membrane proteins